MKNSLRLFFASLFLASLMPALVFAGEAVKVSKEEAGKLLASRIEPVYPPLAKAAKIQGTVVLQVTVNETGTVSSLRAVSGHPMLVPSAIAAVKQWKFTPLQRDDSPVPFIAEVDVVFSLNLSKEDLEREAKYQEFFPAIDKARKALDEDDNDSAEIYARKALEAAEQGGDNKWISIAEAKTLIAHADMGQGKIAEAESLYRESLNIRFEHQKPDESEVAFAQSNLGQCLLEQRRFDEAISLLDDAVNTLKKRVVETEEPQASKGYRRTLAADSFILAKLAELKADHDGAIAHCKDAVENADALREVESKTVVEGCSQMK